VALRRILDVQGRPELLQRADAERPERRPPCDVQDVVDADRPLDVGGVLVQRPACDHIAPRPDRAREPVVRRVEPDDVAGALLDLHHAVAMHAQRPEQTHDELTGCTPVPRVRDRCGQRMVLGAQALAAVIPGAAVQLQRDTDALGEQPHHGGGNHRLRREDVGEAHPARAGERDG
jgi:hypothetical protein